MKKLAYALEITWLVLSILCLAIAIYSIISQKANYMFFILSIVSFFMFQLRRRRRLRNS